MDIASHFQRMTLRYSHPSPGHLNAVNVLDKTLNGTEIISTVRIKTRW
jgi:hypothetical protein